MKLLLMPMFILGLHATNAFADAMPVDWTIAEKFPGATNCAFKQDFNNKFACGEKAAELWQCDYKGKRTDFLVTGVIESDTGGSCSPTFVVEDVLKAK